MNTEVVRSTGGSTQCSGSPRFRPGSGQEGSYQPLHDPGPFYSFLTHLLVQLVSHYIALLVLCTLYLSFPLFFILALWLDLRGYGVGYLALQSISYDRR